MLAALLWDVDGTLAETERDGHRAAFNRAFVELGLPWHWDIARYGRLLRITGGRERLLAAMADEVDSPPLPAERQSLASKLHQLKNHYYAQTLAEGVIPLRPGVRALIAEASARGMRQAIVTTTSRANVDALLAQQFGPDGMQHFDTLICGEDVHAKKPDPQAYHRALDAMRLPALATLAVEDSWAGSAAARAADVPVVVTRSFYFPSDPIDAAVAIGPGLHTRRGWLSAPSSRQAERITLDDLIDWHDRMELVSTVG